MGPVVLAICDGWGIRTKKEGNAPKQARTPNVDRFLKTYDHAVLEASQQAVGLPHGYQGNSEVGHLTIGSGRVVYQNLMRINSGIEQGLEKNKPIVAHFKHVIAHNSTLHLMGLVQDEGVHAHIDHLVALLNLAKRMGILDVVVHVFTDGRDTPATSAKRYIRKVEREFERLRIGRFGVICGRYYAMDRDRRWVRTELAYHALTKARGKRVDTWQEALEDAYAQNQTDEFIRPRIVGDYEGMHEGDSVMFFNYRFDRARQLTQAFVEPDFDKFHTDVSVRFLAMTEYYDGMPCDVAFGPIVLGNLLGDVVSQAGCKQLRISETEKYAHVTFFFNGLDEVARTGEDRILVPSPHVATYDLKPEMSVYEITDRLLKEMGGYDLVVVNLVNGDMVGHTGKISAAIQACEAVDECLGRIEEKVLALNGRLIVTADHGNCEEMKGQHATSHTLNPVNLIVTGRKIRKKEGTLADIAPTIIRLLGLKKPKEMTGSSLV
ncbi:MAG: 2,3-bisphosphoglycerate-independent phosphoglycerate mutase [Nanobdellota archaeon]